MAHQNAELVEHYARGGEQLSLSIRGLDREDMLVRPPADANVGLWSIQQVVIHLQDSDLIAADRMKRVIAEENPSLIGYDESKFASKLFYDEQDAKDAVMLLDLNRRQFARVLRKLPDSAFDRAGQHNERGRETLGHLLKDYHEHLERHIGFIHKKRAWMGKEMW
jgi:hypothetical protein